MNQIDRIARDDYASEENQSWFIDKRHDRIYVRVYQRTERIWLKASTVTHNMGFGGRESLEIETQTRSQWVIMRGNSIEIDGMLLQAELLEMLTIGDDCRIHFSVNPLQCQRIVRSPDEVDISFRTSPRTARLAAWERMRQMFEQGQIEIPRSGYFDRWLESPPHLGRRFELPVLPRGEEVSTPSTDNIVGRWHRCDDIHADSEYEGLGLRTCKYNARSRMIRCAVNPCGPCEGCSHYEKI